MSRLIFLALLGFWTSSSALFLSKTSQFPFTGGCKLATDAWKFNATVRKAAEPLFNGVCLSPVHIQSLYYCGIYHGLTKDQIADGFNYLDGYCLEEGGVNVLTLDEAGVQKDVTRADIEQMNVTYVTETGYRHPPRAPINYLIIPDDRLFDLGFRTERSWRSAQMNYTTYAYAVIWFWAIVLFIGMVYRVIGLAMEQRLLRNTVQDTESSVQKQVSQKSTLWSRFRAHVLLSPFFTYHNRTPIGQMTIPPRLESILIAIYIIINTILTFVNYEVMPDNLYFPGRGREFARFIGDRTGMLAQANLQMVFLFGTRNNIFLWLTNMSFGTFNRFHRWVARICVVHIIIHSAAYTRFSHYNGRAAFAWTQQYWWTGELSTMALCVMLGFSVLWIRKHRYDFFLLSHILLALFGLVTLWYHLQVYEGDFDCWMWPAIAFWAFDRVARLTRLALIWITSPSGRACIIYDEPANIVRVDVSEYFKKLKPRPGSFYFLYTPTKFVGWESHPFTLVTWKPPVDEEPPTTVHVDLKQEQRESLQNFEDSKNSPGSQRKQRYSFTIRPYNGFTKRLRNYCKANVEAAKSTPIMIEGPYGSIHRIRGYTDVLMVIGGTGINVAINHVHDLLQQDSNTRIQLVWALRYTPFLQSVLQQELAEVMKSGRVTVKAYITRREHKLGTDTPVSLEDQDKGVDEDWHVISPMVSKIKFERPDCGQHVAEAATSAPGRLAVLVCGPAAMADDTRVAVIHEIKTKHPQTGFFEEDYGW